MSIRERVTKELERMDEADLERVADYMAFLKFRSRHTAPSRLDDAHLAALYAEAAEEDRRLAEQGLEEYAEGLAREDAA